MSDNQSIGDIIAGLGTECERGSDRTVVIDYTNYRGEQGKRRVVPWAIRWGSNEWHPGPQWLLDAYDVEKGAERTFALKDIHSWEIEPGPAVRRPDAWATEGREEP